MKILNETNWNSRQKRKEAVNNKLKQKEAQQTQQVTNETTSNTNTNSNSITSASMRDLKKAFEEAKSYKEQASYGREMLIRGLSGSNQDVENVTNLNKAFGDEQFSKWLTSFDPDSIPDKSNEFMIFLNDVTSDKFNWLLKDIESFVKLYNSYVHGALKKINNNYISNDKSVIYDEDLYKNTQNNIEKIISLDLNNTENTKYKNAKEKIKEKTGEDLLYTKDDKLRAPGEINSLISKYLGESDNKIIITDYNTGHLTEEQLKGIVGGMMRTEAGRKIIQDAVNNH